MLADDFVQRIGTWHQERFGSASIVRKACKLAEEAGEVCGAVIKRDEIDNGEREGLDEEWTERIEQEIGDVMCVLAAICAYEGISLELLMDDVWARNKDRTWK